MNWLSKINALVQVPLYLLLSAMAGALSVLLLSHSGLNSFSLAPRLAASVATANASSTLSDARQPPLLASLVSTVQPVRPPSLLRPGAGANTDRGATEEGSGRRAMVLRRPAAEAVDSEADQEVEDVAPDAAGLQLVEATALLGFDELFQPGDAVFTEAGSLRLRQKVSELLETLAAQPPEGPDLLRIAVIFPEDEPPAARRLARRYQKRSVAMLRQQGLLPADLRYELPAPEEGGVPAGPASEDAETDGIAAGVPYLSLNYRRTTLHREE